MNFHAIKDAIGEITKDIKLNLTTVFTVEGAPDLTTKQIHFIALASAYATKNVRLCDGLIEEFQISPTETQAAKNAAIIMAMNNIYYRFLHMVDMPEIANLPARLRMNVLNNSGVDKAEFELASLAVSIINGCGKCIDAHTAELRRVGLSLLAIQSTARIAAVINASALALAIA